MLGPWSPFRLPIDVRYRGQPDTGFSFLSLSQKSERCRRSTFLSAHTPHIQQRPARPGDHSDPAIASSILGLGRRQVFIRYSELAGLTGTDRFCDGGDQARRCRRCSISYCPEMPSFRSVDSNELERWQPRPALATSKTQAETPAMTSQASSEKFWAKPRGFLFRR